MPMDPFDRPPFATIEEKGRFIIVPNTAPDEILGFRVDFEVIGMNTICAVAFNHYGAVVVTSVSHGKHAAKVLLRRKLRKKLAKERETTIS